MGKPNYFSNFPNIDYAIESDHAGNLTQLEIKDYFHLLRVREDIFTEDTLYNKYYVVNGERPDQVSYKKYGDERYYWLILQTNDIVDYYNQWPLSSVEFENFVVKKYGSFEGAHETHHYETVETLDSDGNLMLPRGIQVHKDYSFEYRISRDDDDTKKSYPREVTNWEYEHELNEEKANISIIREEYIPDIMRDIKNYARQLGKVSSELTLGTVSRR